MQYSSVSKIYRLHLGPKPMIQMSHILVNLQVALSLILYSINCIRHILRCMLAVASAVHIRQSSISEIQQMIGVCFLQFFFHR